MGYEGNRTGFIWVKVGPNGGLCVRGNELSGSIEGGEFLIR